MELNRSTIPTMETLKRVKDFWQNLRINWTIINLARDMGRYELVIGYLDVSKFQPVTTRWFSFMGFALIGATRSHYVLMFFNFRVQLVRLDKWQFALYIPFKKKAFLGRGIHE